MNRDRNDAMYIHVPGTAGQAAARINGGFYCAD